MQTICDVVLTELSSGVSQRSGKEYYRFHGVIVGCPELPLLAGTRLDKFVSEDVYKELCSLTTDRFYLAVGLSRADCGRECDLGFNVFINGIPKEEEPPEEFVSDPLTDAKTVSDKSEKGGK